MKYKGAAVCLLRRHKGNIEVFLLRRPDGLWEFPGGHRNPHETPAETAKREFLEEMGTDLHCATPVGTIYNRGFYTFVYLVPASAVRELTAKTLCNMDLDEHDDLGWFKLKALPPVIHSEVKRVLTKIRRVIR